MNRKVPDPATGIAINSATEVDALLEQVGPYLAGDRVRHELILGALLLSRRGRRPIRAWWAHMGDRVLGVVAQTGTTAEVSTLGAGAAAPLAGSMARAPDYPLRINGLAADMHDFCAHYAAASGRRMTPGAATRAMQISDVLPPAAPAGARRLARKDDLDLMVEWLQTFDQETGGSPDANFNRALAAGYIERSQLHLWDSGHGPVAATAVFSPEPAMGRLVFVYTPAEHRERGYASRLVAEVADAVLRTGAGCILFTDPANRTSTGIYERMGFRPVDDFREYAVTPPRTPEGRRADSRGPGTSPPAC